MGSQSLQQVAHLAMEGACWSGGGVNYTKDGVSGAAVLSTFDDDQLARTMLETGTLEVIISSVHDAKFVVRADSARSPSIFCAEARPAAAHICATPRPLSCHSRPLTGHWSGGVRAHRIALYGRQ